MDHNDFSKETKLSQAIELAITSGEYAKSSWFMCIALRRMGMEHHIPAVHALVSSIDKKPYPDTPLLCALNDAGIISWDHMSGQEQREYTTQVYCWWVFDLKSKGL